MKNKLLKLVLLITTLSACEQREVERSNDDAAAQIENNAENKSELDYELDALRLMPFLAVHDDPIAAAWLSLQDHRLQNSRNQANYQPTPANIAQYETRIQLLAKQLKEDRRIIANRTVQTRDLLVQNNMQGSVINLLDGMIEVARVGVEGDYGSYCQWYVNLRQSQLSHQDAINKMKELK
ncbi:MULTISPECIES: hypothetical protein [Methylotenera]|uniref:hypothetical protein n=1 Tax=Methylotenera TaxID=359407 RepID=UPI00035FAA65|nr:MULTISPECIES: hypothetical protein [Methylotenera]